MTMMIKCDIVIIMTKQRKIKINCNTIDENQKGLSHEVDLKMEEIFVEDITYNQLNIA